MRGIGSLFSGFQLDLKLGGRMLVKYPGLTLVGGLAMAFAIWAGAVAFVLVGQFLNPTLPLPGGDRIVRVRNVDASANEVEARVLNDFVAWRGSVRSLTDLGAYRNLPLNLIVAGDGGQPVRAAQVTASAFRIAPEPPLLGRTLVRADERPGAPPVVVVGYEVWRTRFEGDPGLVGRTVQLGETHATVVGVMPEGFGFPVAHEVWTPLQPDAVAHAPREGPGIEVFGRLAPGATLEGARAEMAAIGRRAAAQRPDTHQHLRPHVAPYTRTYPEPGLADQSLMRSVNLFAVMLLVVICSNVALLLFARAATRETELVVRSALGASRNRIVAQLFAEALVLGALAAVVGLAAAQLALRHWGVEFMARNLGPLPFWYDVSLSPTAVLYAAALTVLGAAVAGMVPARKITRGLGARLRQSSGGGGGVRFGGVWTAVIVTQIALTVAFPAIAFVQQREAMRIRSYDVGFAAEQYLGVELEMDAGADTAAHLARFTGALEALRRRVAAQPGVAGVTFVDRLPRDYHRERWIELDAAPGAPAPAFDPEVSTASIDPSYFEVLRAPILAGRGFSAADLRPGANVVIVDQGFVDRMMQGRSPVGRRVRFSERGQPSQDESRPWYEIVGVVKDLGMGFVMHRHRTAGVYLPVVPGSAGPLSMIVHAQGDPVSLAPRVREIAADVDPTLRLAQVQRVDEITRGMLWILGLWLRITLMLTGIALLLSLAGIYAVLSFTVARRTREIGVRVALGAPRGRVVAAIFRKPLIQIGGGVAAGFLLVTGATVVITANMEGGLSTDPRGVSLAQIALLAVYGVVMLGVCLLACVVPTRRALRVQPSEALRVE